ncbi:hypothetical protein EVAR_21244_1 [Eumeta japonica]|uniref:Uncharacterized protein n=1 Tax=Eumeta variegata TaxID=151549 RepID=A0A4C1Z3J5_EUMVA|nr:hypothetical protein EVAR_21244_1 [Eumeta japonica]
MLELFTRWTLSPALSYYKTKKIWKTYGIYMGDTSREKWTIAIETKTNWPRQIENAADELHTTLLNARPDCKRKHDCRMAAECDELEFCVALYFEKNVIYSQRTLDVVSDVKIAKAQCYKKRPTSNRGRKPPVAAIITFLPYKNDVIKNVIIKEKKENKLTIAKNKKQNEKKTKHKQPKEKNDSSNSDDH